MNTPKPIKRSKELTPLSRDHHDGLLLCWKIRTGIKNHVDLTRITAYVFHIFDTELNEHFIQEEQYVFSQLSDKDSKIMDALTQHEKIREIIMALRKSEAETVSALQTLADEIDSHIRYEERILFNYIENTISPDKLHEIGVLLNNSHNTKNSANWADEFWVKKT